MDKKFVVKHKYDAAQKDELQLKPGDIVQLLEDVEPGWALGKVNGKTGLYPTNFVVPFEESTANKPTAVKTLSGGKRATDSAFKSSTKKESDQHKQDFKTEASDDEIDGAVVSVSKEVSLTKGDKSHQSGGSSSLNKNKSASQSSLDDILGETSPSHTAERKEKKSGGISSALKKIRPKHKQTASDISGDSKSTMKPSQSGENLSPTSPDQSGAGKSSGSNSSSSKMNKSMESVNSVEDEHENVSRESASSNELLSEIGKTAAVNGGTSSSPTSVVVSPEPTGIILPDNMFPAIEIDAMGGGDIPDHPQQSLGVAKKGIPRQTNKRLPSRDKIRQNAETAETDRAQAMESTAVIATSTPGTPSEDTISDLPPPRDSRVKVGPPIGAVGGNRFGGVPLPGGKDLLSQLKNRQSAIHSGSSPSPQTSVKPSTNSTNTTASAPATPPTPSSVAEARRSFAPGPGAPPPIKHTKPLLSGARPLSTVPQHSTTTTTVTSSQEAELRTVKDTVTRLERRIKELEGQLEQEQESRRRLEAKVDALVKSK